MTLFFRSEGISPLSDKLTQARLAAGTEINADVIRHLNAISQRRVFYLFVASIAEIFSHRFSPVYFLLNTEGQAAAKDCAAGYRKNKNPSQAPSRDDHKSVSAKVYIRQSHGRPLLISAAHVVDSEVCPEPCAKPSGRLNGFCLGHAGLSQVFSDVGGQMQPIGVGVNRLGL